MDGACATLGNAAAIARAREAERVPKDPEHWRVRCHIDRVVLPIHSNFESHAAAPFSQSITFQLALRRGRRQARPQNSYTIIIRVMPSLRISLLIAAACAAGATVTAQTPAPPVPREFRAA